MAGAIDAVEMYEVLREKIGEKEARLLMRKKDMKHLRTRDGLSHLFLLWWRPNKRGRRGDGHKQGLIRRFRGSKGRGRVVQPRSRKLISDRKI